MNALTLQVASDLIAAHIGFVTGSIDREPAMPFRPLAKLPNPQRTDAQPSRAVSPNPATFAPDPPDWDYFNRHSYAELTGGY